MSWIVMLHGMYMGCTWDLHGIYMGCTWVTTTLTHTVNRQVNRQINRHLGPQLQVALDLVGLHQAFSPFTRRRSYSHESTERRKAEDHPGVPGVDLIVLKDLKAHRHTAILSCFNRNLQAYGDWMRLASIRALKLVTSRLLVASSGVLLTVFYVGFGLVSW